MKWYKRHIWVLIDREYQHVNADSILNAGAILYLMGKVGDIRAEVETCRDLIESSRVLTKLSEWVTHQADPSGR